MDAVPIIKAFIRCKFLKQDLVFSLSIYTISEFISQRLEACVKVNSSKLRLNPLAKEWRSVSSSF